MTELKTKPVVLLILDGWGIAPKGKGNAIEMANTPNYDRLLNEYPNTQLEASGEAVGLPKGEDGNSEVGHLNIGSGRIVMESLPRINLSIVNGSFFENEALLKAINQAKNNNSRLHLMGLIGSGGVHAYNDHLYALLQLAKKHQIENLFLHIITDGRDSPPTEGKMHIKKLMDELEQLKIGKIATLMGRYYAMDRDLRWERTKLAYEGLTEVIDNKAKDPLSALERSYQQEITDEFVKPIQIGENTKESRIQDGDGVIFYNFRIDRPRQLTKAFVMDDFEKTAMVIKGFDAYDVSGKKKEVVATPENTPFKRKVVLKNIVMTTMTEYEPGLATEVAFPPQVLENTLGEVVAKAGIKQLRVAETEKERFVTYYFNGGINKVFEGEDRLIVPSPDVATYDLEPEMSTPEIVYETQVKLESQDYGLVVINFACPDMVAHTGDIKAAVKAVEAADEGLGKLANLVKEKEGVLIVTADHGNVEELLSPDGKQVDTEHSTNPVPLIVVWDKRPEGLSLRQGVLADIAPTILKIMGLEQPEEMNGKPLF